MSKKIISLFLFITCAFSPIKSINISDVMAQATTSISDNLATGSHLVIDGILSNKLLLFGAGLWIFIGYLARKNQINRWEQYGQQRQQLYAKAYTKTETEKVTNNKNSSN